MIGVGRRKVPSRFSARKSPIRAAGPPAWIPRAPRDPSRKPYTTIRSGAPLKAFLAILVFSCFGGVLECLLFSCCFLGCGGIFFLGHFLARAPGPRGPGPWAKRPGRLGQGAWAPGPRSPGPWAKGPNPMDLRALGRVVKNQKSGALGSRKTKSPARWGPEAPIQSEEKIKSKEKRANQI